MRYRALSLAAVLLLGTVSARADFIPVITNLDANTFPVTTVSGSLPAITGQSFIAGVNATLSEVKIELDPQNLPTSAPSLVLESSISAVDDGGHNFFAPNGVIYNSFTLSSTDTTTGILTYTATTPFSLVSGVNYWLVATPTGSDSGLSWSFNAPGQTPNQSNGFTIQPNDASFFSNPDSSISYVNPGEAVQLFELSVAIPEPSSMALTLIGVCTLYALKYRRARARRASETV